MGWREIDYPDRDAMADAMAERLADAAEAGLRTRGQAWMALAGGGTPLPAYRRWAERHPPDPRVHLLPTDERWVSANHAACNQSQLRACFGEQSPPHLLPLVPNVADGEPDVEVANHSLSGLSGRFDAVLLGMGADGHFASLFPGAPELAAGLDLESKSPALVVHPDPFPPEAPFARISLSLPRLLSTQRLLLMVSGDAKREVIRAAQRLPDPRRWPIAALLHASDATVEIHWSP